MRRLAAPVALLALVLAAAAAAASPAPRFSGCFGKNGTVKPKQIVVACADGNFSFTGLKWSAWDPSHALAAGTAHSNDCRPNCAAGHFHAYPGSVRLFRPRLCKPGLTLFTRLSWHVSGMSPKNARTGTVSFPVPHVGRC
jgi:hypothetical protein